MQLIYATLFPIFALLLLSSPHFSLALQNTVPYTPYDKDPQEAAMQRRSLSNDTLTKGQSLIDDALEKVAKYSMPGILLDFNELCERYNKSSQIKYQQPRADQDGLLRLNIACYKFEQLNLERLNRERSTNRDFTTKFVAVREDSMVCEDLKVQNKGLIAGLVLMGIAFVIACIGSSWGCSKLRHNWKKRWNRGDGSGVKGEMGAYVEGGNI
ncbi:hypothetical protein BJ508DRAFT_313642 [Ascobolus immersus RN42]|uniref:Protein BIG1 n=1 Tax=Ascobolus immersus RN42 TaxID=1160509 RepID=A0A3N4HNB4_ASCIM|nr:hypothetical protein BJ508DRAFT_313642 [Ascobolus immersus RN42]